MATKLFLKLCLILGISGGTLLINNNCEKHQPGEYRVHVTWFYINKTKHSISYLPDVSFLRQFNVAPFDTTIYVYRGGNLTSILPLQLFRPPLRPSAVVFDGVKIDSLLPWKLRNINSFEYVRCTVNPNFIELFFNFTYENIASTQEQ